MEKSLIFSCEDCITYIIEELGYSGYYEISKDLKCDGFSVQPTQISNYHKGKRKMSEKTSMCFEEYFGVTIVDFYEPQGRPSVW